MRLKLFLGFVFCALVVFPMAIMAHDGIKGRALSIDLASHVVEITTGFDGAQLDLFGVQKEQGDIAVVLEGPRKTAVVRQKSRVVGVWINNRSISFPNVPSHYDYALSKNEEEIASPDTLYEHGIGQGALVFKPEKTIRNQERLKMFQQALVRNKVALQLFPEKPNDIKFVDDGFFRTKFYIPANVPKGDYKVTTYILKDDKVVDSRMTTLKVKQVGFSAKIAKFAKDYGFAYGLMCILCAFLAGMGINALRRGF
jgi:uncharacterized protein (TIGR02186 family)